MDKSEQAVSVFNKHAGLYQEKFMDVNLYGNTFDLFCESIKNENAEILELACGPGNITRYLLNKRPGFKILGTDLSENMIALAKSNNPTAEFRILDCRKIGGLTKKYDAIMCGFCLPYLAKEETIQLIADASDLLRPGGIFYLSTMEDDYSKSGYRKGSTGDEIFMHYYREDLLSDILQKNDFMIIKTVRIDSVMTEGTKVCDLVIIAKK